MIVRRGGEGKESGEGEATHLIECISDDFNVQFVEVSLRYAGFEVWTCESIMSVTLPSSQVLIFQAKDSTHTHTHT